MSLVKVGIVTSDKMEKTVVVEVRTKKVHPLYKKRIAQTSKFKAQNDIGAKTGQKVKIVETKPVSKTVHFKVLEVVE